MAGQRAPEGASLMRPLVERAVAQVPPGRVTTYGDIARALGDIRSARAVAELLSTATCPEDLATHRVVMADGRLGGYAWGGQGAKAERLAAEGVAVRDGRVDPLDAFAIRTFDLPALFRNFARRQQRLAALVDADGPLKPPKVAIGVDASYGAGDSTAHAAAVAVDLNTLEEFASAVAPFTPPIPYVPGYLAFRELPGIEAAVAKLPREARRRAVLFVDGQGILHPRRCGIASMAGLDLKLPAIGVAKGKLVGEVQRAVRKLGAFEGRKVKIDGEARGFELRASKAARALYVSPGTSVSPLQAASLTASLTKPGDESPLPVLLADRLSRRARAEQAHG